ncbi:8-amino-7-oxononanoate synthase [Isoalcanivorax beigongshangi]|uniref:8-amino-7-oxononanoate synthase n=1 Tax=Isoalcanivorax beigongshangi TaxID=3238810 RepID=A0ABV4AMI6_9GAMM
MADFSELRAALVARQQAQRYRTRLTQAAPCGRWADVDGERLLNFSSNDYLGLASDARVRTAFQRGVACHGVGSGASHLVCGHSSVHQALEDALADAVGQPRALLFSSGYMANYGVLTALLRSGDAVFQDRLNHASLLDGGLASGARFRRYPHNDAATLGEWLATSSAPRRLVVTDGVFSMDGDVAPLAALAAASERHNAWLMVDDAHGFGVLGSDGAGSVAAAGVAPQQVAVHMATLGKALGVYGAFVAGDEALIDYLIQFSRPYIYTTALPPALASAALTALTLMQTEPWRRDKLRALGAEFQRGLADLGLPPTGSDTAIQPIVLGDDRRTLQVAQRLRAAGLLVGAIRPPTVPDGAARLRVTLSASHELADVRLLLTALERALASPGPAASESR